MISLLIATRNLHKVDEIRAVLGDGFHYLTLKDYPGAPEVVEDAGTFAGNSTKKAAALARWVAGQGTGVGRELFVLADDSGLEVDALNGEPGVHSARFSALDSGQPGNSPAAQNNAKLLRLLKEVPANQRTARFRCVLALTPVSAGLREAGSPARGVDVFETCTRLFEGSCTGRIIFEPRGRLGFGYDPLFMPDGFGQTFAELGEETKNRLSHRGRALAKMLESGVLGKP